MAGEVHVITCGTSLIRNFAQEVKISSLLDRYPDLLDSLRSKAEAEQLLRKFSPEDKHALKLEMLNYLKQDPRKASAEINSLFGYIKKIGGDISKIKELVEKIHLISTDTESGKLAADVLKEYLESLGLIVDVHVVPGFGRKDFSSAVKRLVETVRGIVKPKENVVFNLTAGYKPETAAMAVLAVESDIKQYYMHELSEEAVVLPSASELSKNEKMGEGCRSARCFHEHVLLPQSP